MMMPCNATIPWLHRGFTCRAAHDYFLREGVSAIKGRLRCWEDWWMEKGCMPTRFRGRALVLIFLAGSHFWRHILVIVAHPYMVAAE